MPQKHTPLQSFPFDIRTVEKRCSYVNTISINLALIKSNGNSDVVNILDMYAKDRHFFANSAPEAGNVSNREKSGTSRNFPLMCKIMAETAPTRPILSPPAAPFLSAAAGRFRAPARPTFANSGKSGQKRRSNLRFEDPPAPRTCCLAVLRSTRTRQSENHPKCGIDLLLSPLPLNVQNVDLRSGAFQSKSGSAQRNTSVQHFGRIRTHRQAAEGNPKTMGFWRRSFPHYFRC